MHGTTGGALLLALLALAAGPGGCCAEEGGRISMREYQKIKLREALVMNAVEEAKFIHQLGNEDELMMHLHMSEPASDLEYDDDDGGGGGGGGNDYSDYWPDYE